MTAEQNPSLWFLYVIQTVDQTLYTGISTDPERRFKEHCLQGARTAKYLKAHIPKLLVLAQAVGSRSVAAKLEYKFKNLPKTLKESVIQKGYIHYDEETGDILIQ